MIPLPEEGAALEKLVCRGATNHSLPTTAFGCWASHTGPLFFAVLALWFITGNHGLCALLDLCDLGT